MSTNMRTKSPDGDANWYKAVALPGDGCLIKFLMRSPQISFPGCYGLQIIRAQSG